MQSGKLVDCIVSRKHIKFGSFFKLNFLVNKRNMYVLEHTHKQSADKFDMNAWDITRHWVVHNYTNHRDELAAVEASNNKLLPMENQQMERKTLNNGQLAFMSHLFAACNTWNTTTFSWCKYLKCLSKITN